MRKTAGDSLIHSVGMDNPNWALIYIKEQNSLKET